MIKTFKIAKLELSILFYSPVAWLVLTIFVVQSGMGFLGMFSSYQEALSLGNPVDRLTFSMFPGLNGLFDTVQQNLYLYIPLLTMGLMSREISSGSIKLLLSSPVKIREIIIGKYLAMVGYGLLLIAILAIYATAGYYMIKDADVMLIISGLIGLFLLICTYAAIGLFMSSLTSYQVVAAISTLAVFAALRFVGTIGQDIDFIRDLTYFLSITGRADDMLKGLITTKDMLYFLIIIVLFLSLCIQRLQNGREAKSVVLQTVKYAVFFFTALMLGYISARPGFIGYLDMTATKSRTLTKASQAIARQIDGPLVITTYVNLLDQNVYFGLPASRNFDLEKFSQFQRFIPGLEMKYVYYYDAADLKNNSNMSYQGDLTGLSIKQIAEKVADNMGLDLDMFMTPAQVHQLIDLQPENNSVVRVLTYKGKTSRLRFYDGIDQFPGETEIAAAIKRLIIPAPRIAFITGNNERSIEKTGDRNYQMMSSMKRGRNALINQGFDVFNVDLTAQEIPDSLAGLVLADPTTPLSTLEMKKIESYLDKGGNMLITGEPGRQGLLNPLLQSMGLMMKAGMLVNPTKDDSPDLIYGKLKSGSMIMTIAMQGAAGLEQIKPGHAARSVRNTANVMETVLTPDQNINSNTRSNANKGFANYTIDTLIESPSRGWNKQGEIDLTSTDVKFNPEKGDQKGTFPIVLSLTRKAGDKMQRIIVSGDADFMNNAELQHPRGFNASFVKSIFSWFSEGNFPVDTSRPVTTDDDILVNRKGISRLKMIFLGLFPGLIIALGAYILISRKRN